MRKIIVYYIIIIFYKIIYNEYFLYTVKAACIDSLMYRYIGSNDNFKYICWNFHLIHVREYRVYRQSAVSTKFYYTI